MIGAHLVEPQATTAALATLRELLDLENTEIDESGRYVLDFAAMGEVVEAIDDLEEALVANSGKPAP